jgi:hypothetical protein
MNCLFKMGMLIHGNSNWLGGNLTGLSDESLSAHDERKFSLAAVKAGACLEGLLVKMLEHWDIPCDVQPTLGPLIGAVRKANRAPGPLLERLNEANAIRNRAPHNKPSPMSQVTEGDSLQLLNILTLVVDWCRGELGYKDSDSTNDLTRVFLSVGGPHRLEQAQFLRHLRSEMRSLGVQLHTLPSDRYSPDKPFDDVCDLMRTCRAALVIGLERSHAYTVFERERSEDQRVRQDQYIPTAWNQIEGGMASALRLPILVLRERHLYQEGIFEAASHRHQIREFDLATESRGLSIDLRDYLSGWVQHILRTIVPVSGDLRPACQTPDTLGR